MALFDFVAKFIEDELDRVWPYWRVRESRDGLRSCGLDVVDKAPRAIVKALG
jgi:hypothetical protein